MNISWRKKELIIGAAIFFAVALLFVYAEPVLAQPVQTKQGNSIVGGVLKTIGAPAVAIIAAALWIIQVVLSLLLGLLGIVMDSMFASNIDFVPAAYPVVLLGWGVLRDIANAFFILILIWIALTIIFSLDQFGGRKLLFRVIVVALLINFSLAFVATVFGFSNAVADVFYQKFPRDPATKEIVVAQYIKNALRADTFFTPLANSDETKKVIDEHKKSFLPPNVPMAGLAPGDRYAFSSALGIQEAEALPVPVVLGLIRLGTLAWKALKVAGIAFAVGGGVSLAVGDVYTLSMQLAMIDIMLLIIVVVFAIISVMLIMRLIATIFLCVLAPAAFFLHAAPGGYGERYWKMWLDALIRWAFFLPVFAFLFYLALFFLQGFHTDLAKVKMNAAAAPHFFLLYLVAAGFMLASVWAARKTAGGMADVGINWATKIGSLALGAATGGAALVAAPLIRQARPALERGLERVQERPILAKAIRPVTRKVTEALEEQEGRVTKEMDKHKHLSDDHVAQGYASSWGVGSAEEKVARARILAERGKFNKLSASEQEESLKLASQFGPRSAMAILKARPDLARKDLVPEATDNEDALRRVVEKIKVDEASKVSEEALTPQVMTQMWKTFSATHVAEMKRHSPQAVEKMMQHLTPGRVAEIRPDTYQFLNNSTTARGLGLSLPAGHAKPDAVKREEAARTQEKVAVLQRQLDELDITEQGLRAKGLNKEADKTAAKRQYLIARVERLRRDLAQFMRTT